MHRTNDQHPRKIHAKEIITDKMAMAGSTNLSNKGMRDNWEMSGIVEFREDDPDSVAMRERLKTDFLKTWNEESIELNSKQIANKRLASANSPDLGARKDEARHTIVLESLNAIEAYANESTQLFSRLALSPQVAAALANMPKTMSPGYALLKSVEQTVGTDALQKQLHAQPTYQSLLQLQSGQRR